MTRSFLSIVIAFLCAQHTLLFAEEPQTIVTFGDSVTAKRGSTVVYSTILANELSYDGKGVKVINAGVGGHTTNTAAASAAAKILRHSTLAAFSIAAYPKSQLQGR